MKHHILRVFIFFLVLAINTVLMLAFIGGQQSFFFLTTIIGFEVLKEKKNKNPRCLIHYEE